MLGNRSWSSAREESTNACAPSGALAHKGVQGGDGAGAGSFACSWGEQRRTHQAGGRTVIHTASACAAASVFSADAQHEREHRRSRPAQTLRDAPPSAPAAAPAAAPRTTRCAGACHPHPRVDAQVLSLGPRRCSMRCPRAHRRVRSWKTRKVLFRRNGQEEGTWRAGVVGRGHGPRMGEDRHHCLRRWPWRSGRTLRALIWCQSGGIRVFFEPCGRAPRATHTPVR